MFSSPLILRSKVSIVTRNQHPQFTKFFGERFPDLQGPEDVDDALVEFKQEAAVSKAGFEFLVAAVEHPFPKFRGELQWAHGVIKGWAVQRTPRHTTPKSRAQAKLYAVPLCSLNAEKLAAGLLLQRELGLCHSELLGLLGCGVALSGTSLARDRVARGARVRSEETN